MPVNQNKLQDSFNEILEGDRFIDYSLDFNGGESCDDIAAAACELLVENFGIAVDGSYIKEIIEQACYQSALIGYND